MGRRPIGTKAMTAAERMLRMRQRREDEANSLRREIQLLKDALPSSRRRRTKVDMSSTAISRRAELRATTDARIAKLKSPTADDDNIEWFAEHINPDERLSVAKKLMEGLDPAPTTKRRTQLWLIVSMISALPNYERRVTLIAGIVAAMEDDKVLADFVQALRPTDRKRLATALAKRPSRR
jgi:hypothetical protein